jgi:pimeloyl-ACP methyl ester carboxylesterase
MTVGAYLEVDPGVEIYYEDQGTGTPLVFVPGWTFTTDAFAYQMAHFSKTHRVILMDPRSHGRSTVTPAGSNYAAQGADLAKLIEALDLEDVVLVGWSFGCLTNWAYVRQAGIERIKAVVGIDLSPKPLSVNEGDWVEGPLDEIGQYYNMFLQSPQGQRDFVAAYATEVMVQRALTDEELAWIIGMSLNTPYYIAAAFFAAGMFDDYREEAKLVDASLPALHIIAEHWADLAVPFMNELCPKTKTAVLGGHLMFWEHHEAFNAILDEFLGGL